MGRATAAVALLLLELQRCPTGAAEQFQSHLGVASYYSTYTTQSCSNTDYPDDNLFAEGSSGGEFDTYASGENCGKYFSVKCVEEGGVCKTTEPIRVKVVDNCGCPGYAFLLSKEAFESLADVNTENRISVHFSGPFDLNSSGMPDVGPPSNSLNQDVGSRPEFPKQDIGSPPDSTKENKEKKFPLSIVLGVLGGLSALALAVTLAVILRTLTFRRPPDVDLSNHKPSDIHQVSNHLHELFPFARRRTRTTVNPEVDIVLFHGPARDQQSSDEAYWQTWMTNDGHFFPQYLGEDYPNCRIHSVSYNARVDSREGQLDDHLLAENLQSDIILSNPPGIGQTCPVVLIGHSTGGNVINRFILELVRNPSIRENANFLHNLRGIYYFSTPHRGMKLEALLISMGAHSLKTTGPIYQPMNQLNERLVRLTEELKRWLNESGTSVTIVSVWEGPLQKFRWWHKIGACMNRCFSYCHSRSFQIVTEASSRDMLRSRFITIERVNHFTVCKIMNRADSRYQQLEILIKESVGEGPLTRQPCPGNNIESNNFSGSQQQLQFPAPDKDKKLFLVLIHQPTRYFDRSPCMLLGTGLPTNLWRETVHTTDTYLINLPLEQMAELHPTSIFTVKLDLTGLKVFSCLALFFEQLGRPDWQVTGSYRKLEPLPLIAAAVSAPLTDRPPSPDSHNFANFFATSDAPPGMYRSGGASDVAKKLAKKHSMPSLSSTDSPRRAEHLQRTVRLNEPLETLDISLQTRENHAESDQADSTSTMSAAHRNNGFSLRQVAGTSTMQVPIITVDKPLVHARSNDGHQSNPRTTEAQSSS